MGNWHLIKFMINLIHYYAEFQTLCKTVAFYNYYVFNICDECMTFMISFSWCNGCRNSMLSIIWVPAESHHTDILLLEGVVALCIQVVHFRITVEKTSLFSKIWYRTCYFLLLTMKIFFFWGGGGDFKDFDYFFL